jgi:hypothetical protein
MKNFNVAGISWDGNTVWGDPAGIDAVKAALRAQAVVQSLRDEVMRLQIRLKAAEDRIGTMSPAYEAALWAPGTYQNGA